jgi:glycosyl transferase family 2
MTAERRFLASRPAFVWNGAPTPTFSVVVPAYQAAAFIGDAIESALGQSLPPHEVIVSDDGSTDDLPRALARFGDRVRLVRSEHGGPAAARNRALDAATGDFIAALDADDVYRPGRLEALAELVRARPDLDVVATDAALEVNGAVIGTFREATPFPVDDQRHAVLHACFVCAPAVRRVRLLALGGYDETLEAGEDWDILLRLIFAGCPAGLVDEPLYAYRQRAGSVTSARLGALTSRVQLLEKATHHPGLSVDEAAALERSLIANRTRLLRAQAEVALLEQSADRRTRALRLAAARGVDLRERARAVRWAAAGRPRDGERPRESVPLWSRG